MRKDYVITMSTTDRKRYEKICKEVHDILVEDANKINDPEERANFWSKIRNFNDVSDVFKD